MPTFYGVAVYGADSYGGDAQYVPALGGAVIVLPTNAARVYIASAAIQGRYSELEGFLTYAVLETKNYGMLEITGSGNAATVTLPTNMATITFSFTRHPASYAYLETFLIYSALEGQSYGQLEVIV